MAKKSLKKNTSREAAPKVDFLTIDGVKYSLGDIRKADFSTISTPEASVNSLVEWAEKVTNALQGISS